MEFESEKQVLDQSFRFRTAWWTSHVPEGWLTWLSDLPELERDYRRIARADLIGADGTGETRDPGRVLVAAYVWGTGSWGFLAGRRARVFRDTTPERITEALSAASDLLHSAGPVEAYRSMLRGNANYLKHLGPSFFTKALYAFDAQNGQPGRALILDRFVALALNDIHEWRISRTGPWSPETYGRWLDLAHDIAQEQSESGRRVRPDAVEMAYFKHGRSL